MIEQFLEWMTNLLQLTPAAALLAAFLWGIFSIILSPCYLAGVPLIVGFSCNQKLNSPSSAFRISVLFAIGVLVSIACIGAATAVLGRVIGDIGSIGTYIVAFLFLLLGLNLMDVLPLSWESVGCNGIKVQGYRGAVLMGLVFGMALGPCTFAFLAPLLGVVFKIASSKFSFAILLIAAFVTGHCLLIALSGVLTERVQNYLAWTESSKAALSMKRISGLCVLLGGVYMLLIA